MKTFEEDREILEHCFPELSQEQVDKLMHYATLLLEWNSKINLISRKDEDRLIKKHFLQCLAMLYYHPFTPKDRVLDVGTGGGLPGIPLAIAYPEVSFTLIDSIGKKIKAVQAMVADLGLTNVDTKQARAEELKIKCSRVVARGVTDFVQFVSYVRPLLLPHGKIFYLKGYTI